jgi:hypothetical protein
LSLWVALTVVTLLLGLVMFTPRSLIVRFNLNTIV